MGFIIYTLWQGNCDNIITYLTLKAEPVAEAACRSIDCLSSLSVLGVIGVMHIFGRRGNLYYTGGINCEVDL